MPALGPGWSLRFDPPGSGGTCQVARIWFEERVIYPPPAKHSNNAGMLEVPTKG